MAFSELERKRVERDARKFLERRRPPPHIRHEVDIDVRVVNQSLEIFEVRQYWLDRTQTVENPVAKATYVKVSDTWKIYWMRADLKWHRYDPLPEVDTLQEFLDEVDEDPFAAFWG